MTLQILMMDDCSGLHCSVCGKLAQYAVLTPCCSRLACRVCAITNIVKFQGRCGLDSCHEDTVLIPSLVPNQQVRRKVEEKEVWNEVVTFLPYIEPNMVNRTLDHTSEPNQIESKKIKGEQKPSILKRDARNALLTAIANATSSSGGNEAFPDTLEKSISKEKSESYPEFDAEHLPDKNGNILSERQSDVNATSKWRVIFMDCEKIFDGDHSQFTQIGCYVYRVSNRRKSTFFLSMYPTKNEEYLLMKQKSDLLKTLHVVWGEETGFQFVQPDGGKVKAFSESDGLEQFLSFLGEGEDNVLFLSNASCILPLLLNKINPNRLQKYVTGICELKTFLTESLGSDNDLTNISHTDDIYQRVMGKPFEEITPTCGQTAKYMFQLVEKIHAEQGNRRLDFKSFISKYFKPTSHFEKFSNFGAIRNESTSGDKILVQIESSFRAGFLASVEMCSVELIDLTGLQEKTSQCLNSSKNSQPKSSLPKFEPKSSLPKFEPKSSLPKFEPKSSLPKFEPKLSLLKFEPNSTLPKSEPKLTLSKFELKPKLSFPKLEPKFSLPLPFPSRRGISSVKDDDSRRNLCEQSSSKNPPVLSRASMSLCPLCGSLCADAVRLPCCGVSTCEACAWQMLFWGNFICSLCKRSRVTPDHLIPDFSLRKNVWNIINSQRGAC